MSHIWLLQLEKKMTVIISFYSNINTFSILRVYLSFSDNNLRHDESRREHLKKSPEVERS